MKFSMFIASFEARSLSANFFSISHIIELVNNFFQLFEVLFLSISMRAIASFSCCFRCPYLSDSLIILPKISPLVNAFFSSFFRFFYPSFFTPVFMRFSPLFHSSYALLPTYILLALSFVLTHFEPAFDLRCKYIQSSL